MGAPPSGSRRRSWQDTESRCECESGGDKDCRRTDKDVNVEVDVERRR